MGRRETIARTLVKLLEECLSQTGWPGVTGAIVYPDGSELAVAAGFSDREAPRAMEPRDRMLAGSIPPFPSRLRIQCMIASPHLCLVLTSRNSLVLVIDCGEDQREELDKLVARVEFRVRSVGPTRERRDGPDANRTPG